MYNNKLFSDADIFCADFECPKTFTYWAFIQAVSIANGKRVQIEIGSEQIPLNLFVILCGLPSVKGKQAIKLCRELLDSIDFDNYLPDNLGQRRTQGLVAAMMRNGSSNSIDDEMLASAKVTEGFAFGKGGRPKTQVKDYDALFNSQFGQPSVPASPAGFGAYDNFSDVRNKAYVSEDFVSFCSGTQQDFYGLLGALWRCENYTYTASTHTFKLENPYLNIFTSMTQIGLMDTFPDTYIGINTMATFIVVLEEEPQKKCPYPKARDMRKYCEVQQHLQFAMDKDSSLSLSDEALAFGSSIYSETALDSDTRFLNYLELRHTHLHKVAACLALYEGRTVISKQDLEDANTLLSEAESHLPDALGEFGNTKISQGRQKCLDLIRREEVMRKSMYRARCASFLFSKDFEMFLTDMMVQKKLIEEWNEQVNDYMIMYNPNYKRDAKAKKVTVEDMR